MDERPETLLAACGPRLVFLDEFRGGEGRTLHARDDRDGSERIVKVLPQGFAPEEAALLLALRHPAIPAVIEVGRLPDGRAFVVREFAAGVAPSPLPAEPPALVAFVRELLEVLAYVHRRGIVHLDLKPHNLVRGTDGRLRLLDFGLAARRGERGRGGTPFYAAPELLLGAVPDARADLFAVGAIAVQALWPSGRLPLARFLERFPAADFWTALGRRADDFPAPFPRFLERCLARRPARRFQDAQAALEFLCGGSGRPSLALLTPDPALLWQDELARAAAVPDGDVVVRGGGPADRRAIAMHLAAVLPGIRGIAEAAAVVRLERNGGGETAVELPPLSALRLAPHLESALGLQGRAATAAAEWLLLGGARDPDAVRERLVLEVESGAIQAAGSRWIWPAAQNGRLVRSDGERLAPTAENVRALAARGQREAALALWRRAQAAEPAAEPALRAALAEGLLDGGEPAAALPFCIDEPVLRAQALLDLGDLAAAAAALARAGGGAHARRRRVEAQLLLARGDAAAAAHHLTAPVSIGESLTRVAALDAAGEAAACAELLTELLARISPVEQPFAYASAVTVAGHVARRRGDLVTAAAHFARAADLLYGIGNARHAASARLNLGVVAKDQGNDTAAVECLREARALYASASDRAGVAVAAANLGSAALARGDADAALPWLREAADELQRLGNRDAGRIAHAMLARAAAANGDRAAAEAALAVVGTPDTERLRAEVARVHETLRSAATASRPGGAPAAAQESPDSPTAMPNPGPSRELFRTFLAVNRQIAQETDLDKAMRHLLDAAVTLSGGRQGYLLVVRDNGMQREFQSGDPGPTGQAFSRSLAHRAIDLQRTLTGTDVLADSELQEAPSIRNLQIRSAICSPFASAGGTRGAIYVEHPGRAGVFGEADKESLEVLADQAAIAVDRMLREEAMARELEQSRRELQIVKRQRRKGTSLLGDSQPMRALRSEIERLAPLELPVLVGGETGTGKELVARALHDMSPRGRSAFVAENCSALPAELLERELFGHVQGAFTGADRDRPGLLELANGGTLFLDEVGDMPPAMQAKLLRALQEQSIRRVGGSELIRLDLRLVAATHRDLRAMIARGEFREDLFFRLAAVELRVPPLRERGADVLLLAEHFLRQHGEQHGRTLRLSASARAALVAYPWPGNVRELEHVIARAALLGSGEEVSDLQLPRVVVTGNGGDRTVEVAPAPVPVEPLKEVERRAIQNAMQQLGGDKTKVARALGISRTALYEKLKRYELG